jgi:hypothetical protein
MEVSASCPVHFSPWERALDTHWIGGWVGPRASLDTVEKRKVSYSCKQSNPGYPTHSLLPYWLSCLGSHSSKRTFSILQYWRKTVSNEHLISLTYFLVLSRSLMTLYIHHNQSIFFDEEQTWRQIWIKVATRYVVMFKKTEFKQFWTEYLIIPHAIFYRMIFGHWNF